VTLLLAKLPFECVGLPDMERFEVLGPGIDFEPREAFTTASIVCSL